MKTRKPKIGRPPLPAAERRSELVKLRATVDEIATLDALASAWETDRSGAVRRAVDEAHTRVARSKSRR